MASLIEYPTEFPAEILPDLLAILQGNLPEPHHAVRVLYHAIGYGLHLGYADQPPMTRAVAAQHVAAAGNVGKINWGGLIGTLLPILIQILGGLGK